MRVSIERFEELAIEAIDGLPEWVKAQMGNVNIVLEDQPPRNEPRLMGLYEGVPLTQRGAQYSGLPDKITLYRSTIERGAANEAALAAAIRHVVRHEVAHFMGISDQELMDMGRY